MPRVLARKQPLSLAELKAQNQRLLVRRAAQVVDLYAVPSDDVRVVECRRVATDDGGHGPGGHQMSRRLRGARSATPRGATRKFRGRTKID